MAIASIETTIPSKPTVVGASREDLEIGDVVTVDSFATGSLYSWSLAYIPEGSLASFTGSTVMKSPGTFTVDVEGSYLIRLEFTDGTGTTEQFVRLRALTSFGQLKLVAAGETPGATNIPVDITSVGWADDQNYNLNRLLALIQTYKSPSMVKFNFDHTTGVSTIAPLSAGDVVVKVFVSITTVFDDPASTIEIGDATTSGRFVSSGVLNLSAINKYELSTIDSISSNTNIIYTPTPGTSTQGEGFILALVHKN